MTMPELNDTCRRTMLFGWSVIAAFYGLNLYFSRNGDINNPIVHPAVPVVKDLLWLLVLTSMLSISWRNPEEHKGIYLLLFGLAILHILFALGVVAIFAFKYFTLYEYNYLRFVKNMLLYTALAYVFAVAIYRRGMHHYFLRITFYCITASLLVAVMLHFTVESLYNPTDLRMFGTYGNPNSVGFMALLNIALAYVFGNRNSHSPALARSIIYLALVGSFAALMLSASISALLATALYLVGVRFTYQYFGITPALTRIPVIKALLLGVSVVTALSLLSEISVSLVSRVDSLSLGGTPVSVSVRAHDYAAIWGNSTSVLSVLFGSMPSRYVQFDASLLTYYFHFGVTGLLVLSLPFMVVLWNALSLKGIAESELGASNAQLVAYLVPALLILFVVNIPLQYQYQVFPTNYFYSVITGLMIIVCGKVSFSSVRDLLSTGK